MPDVPESRATGVRRRSALTWLLAAVAAAVIVGAAVVVLVLGDDDVDRAPGPSATVTELTAPAGEPGRCLPPSAEALRGTPVAFDGTVEAIGGGLVTLEPTRWYAGQPTDRVTVRAPGERLGYLLTAVRFEEGDRYLVAGHEDGTIMVCGFSGPWSAGRERMYAEAFPG